jgi:hypothetical protein
MDQGQSYRSHTRIVPLYHYGVLGIFFVYFVWAAADLRNGATLDRLMTLLMAAALLVFAVVARTMILRVQDRVIRLEMRLRLREILPQDLNSRAKDLTTRQLVALRFACDAEMPDLVRDVLDGKLASQKEIKMKIRDWQGDYLRA